MSLFFLFFACAAATEEKIAYPTKMLSENERYELSYETDPSPIPLNDEFILTMTIADQINEPQKLEGIDVTIDAEMPDHGHGMPQSPVTTQLETGTFQAEGMFFQMPGYWHILVWITEENGTIEKTIFEVDCCQ